jgi:hypothetical protein
MPIKKARNHFLGKDGCPRFNCAQSVLAGFSVDEATIMKFDDYGSGNTPDGWCGAAEGAAFLLNDRKIVEQYFIEHAGSTKCSEIRKTRKISCIGCVEKAAEIVKTSLVHPN